MTKKKKIIMLSIILSIFLIVMIIIAVTRKPKDDPKLEVDPNYAINETRYTKEEEEIATEAEVESIIINGKEITHLERLTPEQHAAKSEMYDKLHNRVLQDETKNKKVVTEEISESTTKYDVFVSVTFSDGTVETYVVGYDATDSHSFLRCTDLEEYEYYNSDANCG